MSKRDSGPIPQLLLRPACAVVLQLMITVQECLLLHAAHPGAIVGLSSDIERVVSFWKMRDASGGQEPAAQLHTSDQYPSQQEADQTRAPTKKFSSHLKISVMLCRCSCV